MTLCNCWGYYTREWALYPALICLYESFSLIFKRTECSFNIIDQDFVTCCPSPLCTKQEASRDRARAMERIQEELEAANTEMEELRKKLEGSKARAKILDNENKKMKSYVQTLLEKTGTDDELIDALRGELKSMRDKVVKSSLAMTAMEMSSPSRETSEFESRTMKQTIDQVGDAVCVWLWPSRVNDDDCLCCSMGNKWQHKRTLSEHCGHK